MCERNVRIAGLTMWCLMVWLLSVAPAGAAIVVRTSEGEYDTDVTAYLWSVVSVRAGGADNRMRIGEGRASVAIRDQRERFRLGPSGLDFGGEKTIADELKLANREDVALADVGIVAGCVKDLHAVQSGILTAHDTDLKADLRRWVQSRDTGRKSWVENFFTFAIPSACLNRKCCDV